MQPWMRGSGVPLARSEYATERTQEKSEGRCLPYRGLWMAIP